MIDISINGNEFISNSYMQALLNKNYFTEKAHCCTFILNNSLQLFITELLMIGFAHNPI